MPVILKRMLVARMAPFVTRLRHRDLFERVRTPYLVACPLLLTEERLIRP